jgi:hypothetical protein
MSCGSAPSATDAELLRALLHRVCEQPVDSEHGEHERRAAEDAHQQHVEALARSRKRHDFFHGFVVDDRHAGDLADLVCDRVGDARRRSRGAHGPRQRNVAEEERVELIRELRLRHVHRRRRLGTEIAVANVGDDADDLSLGLNTRNACFRSSSSLIMTILHATDANAGRR